MIEYRENYSKVLLEKNKQKKTMSQKALNQML